MCPGSARPNRDGFEKQPRATAKSAGRMTPRTHDAGSRPSPKSAEHAGPPFRQWGNLSGSLTNSVACWVMDFEAALSAAGFDVHHVQQLSRIGLDDPA